MVALRKESVDRNVNLRVLDGSKSSSLSARRAWIEMRMVLFPAPAIMVALRKESVDRNVRLWVYLRLVPRSLSARRAWIEIGTLYSSSSSTPGRSPQGERG